MKTGNKMTTSNTYVRIINGKTKLGTVINDEIFQFGRAGMDEVGHFITIVGDGREGMRNGRTVVYCNPTKYEFVNKNGDKVDGPANGGNDNDDTKDNETSGNEVTDTRTDEEIRIELVETFEILAELTSATVSGVVKGLIVSGPAGVGKSHTVETTLYEASVVARLSGIEPNFDVVKGHLSGIQLHCLLYKYRHKGSVLVLDDADTILYDEDCLNHLKAVLDTKKVRRVHWGTMSHHLEKEDVPTVFEFEGSVIFLSNIKWDQTRSNRIQNHLRAIMSRSHYISLNMDTLRERIIHITNTVRTTNMLEEYNFSDKDVDEVMEWVISNVNRIAFVDLRTVIKACDFKLAMKEKWKKFAERSLFKN